jgi:hypothetical protein
MGSISSAGMATWLSAGGAATWDLVLGGANALAMRVTSAGYTLLGGYTASQGAYPLQVSGQIYSTSAAIATSDQQFKSALAPLPAGQGLALVKALKPGTFTFNADSMHNFPTGTQLGLIAQDVQTALAGASFIDSIVHQIAPEPQITYPETGGAPVTTAQAPYLGLADTGPVTALLIAAIQDLAAQVTAQAATIATLQTAVAALTPAEAPVSPPPPAAA